MINFSAVPGGSVLGRVLRSFLRVIPKGTTMPILQGRAKGLKWTVGAGDNNGFWIGSYELDTQKVIAEHATPGKVVYDIGANAGFFTLLASVLVGEKGRVLAFEPLPDNVDSIRRHLRMNKISNVELRDVAVAGQEGEMSFQRGVNAAEGMLSDTGDIKVKVVTIDALVFKQETPPPDLMKIDVEGAELSLLEGARETLVRYAPIIVLSTHGEVVHKACLNFLKTLGYQMSTIGAGTSLENTSNLLCVK